MKLWLVRHARPLIDAGVCYGALDVPADDVATRAAAAQLAISLPQTRFLSTSPLQRCEQLTQYLRGLRADLIPNVDNRLAEMNFGTWEGRRWDAIGQTALAAWTDDFAQHPPGGGESVRAFMARVEAAMVQTATNMAVEIAADIATGIETEAIWITHAGVIRAATLIAGGVRQIERADQWPVNGPAWGETVVLDL
ncbi:MAG: hypothetical protein RIS34_1396 [Pseudomonadota bacterium]